MKLMTAFALVLLSIQAQAACDITFTRANLCMNIEWTLGPQVYKESKMNLKVTDLSTQQPVSLTTPPKVELYMDMGNGRGHGTGPKQPIAETVSPGVYAIKNMFFLMEGTWQIRIDVPVTTGQAERQVVEKDIKK